MATLQKFKLLATQCAVITSPARSPTTSPSPVIHIRRRKTLRMLLGKSTTTAASSFNRRFLRREEPPSSPPPPPRRSGVGVRSKLKDLFVASPPETAAGTTVERGGEGIAAAVKRGGGGSGGVRPLSATLRQRLLLRRAWKPVLIGIPEVSP